MFINDGDSCVNVCTRKQEQIRLRESHKELFRSKDGLLNSGEDLEQIKENLLRGFRRENKTLHRQVASVKWVTETFSKEPFTSQRPESMGLG